MLVKDRDSSIDQLRGFAAIFVILGHLEPTPHVIVYWIYSFHMPLFFICSGLVFSASVGFKDFFIKKIKTLLVPYFCLGMLRWFLNNFMKFGFASVYGTASAANWSISDLLLSLLLGHRLHSHYIGMWFLCTLFFGELIFFFIVKLNKNHIILPITVVIGIMAQHFIFQYVQGFYWSIDIIPACLAFMAIGYMLKRSMNNGSIYRCRYIPVALAASILFAYLGYMSGGKVDLNSSTMGNPMFYFLAAISGSWVFAIFSKNIGELNPLIFFGRNSLITYVFQTAFTVPFSDELYFFLSRKFPILSDHAFQWFFEFSVVLILSYLLIVIINRCFPWMVGKRYPKRA